MINNKVASSVFIFCESDFYSQIGARGESTRLTKMHTTTRMGWLSIDLQSNLGKDPPGWLVLIVND